MKENGLLEIGDHIKMKYAALGEFGIGIIKNVLPDENKESTLEIDFYGNLHYIPNQYYVVNDGEAYIPVNVICLDENDSTKEKRAVTRDNPFKPNNKKDDGDIRSYNVGKSDYAKHKIQPWDIWTEYKLNPWDSDIVKRVLREKEEPGMTESESRILDYEKIIHVAKFCISLIKDNKYFKFNK